MRSDWNAKSIKRAGKWKSLNCGKEGKMKILCFGGDQKKKKSACLLEMRHKKGEKVEIEPVWDEFVTGRGGSAFD